MLKTAPLQIRAYEHLREMIEENQLEDGVIYSETRLAKEIGVSRTPMRDALQKLEQEGLIEISRSGDHPGADSKKQPGAQCIGML